MTTSTRLDTPAPDEAEAISVYEAIGGRAALVAAVDGFFHWLLADPRLRPFFPDGSGRARGGGRGRPAGQDAGRRAGHGPAVVSRRYGHEPSPSGVVGRGPTALVRCKPRAPAPT
jgi:hypothetical protein